MGITVVARAEEGVVAGVGAEVAEANASVAATCAEVADAVLEDGGAATPSMRSRIAFKRRILSSILDIEAQRSAVGVIWDPNMAGFRKGARSREIANWAKKFWGKVGVKALNTNCHDPSLLNSKYKSL